MNYAMCAGTRGKDLGKMKLEKNGLVPGHIYSLLSCKKIEDKDGKE